MKNKKNIICFVAGHSGGHIIPCATQAQKENLSGNAILFISTQSKLDKQILNNYNFIEHKIFLNIHGLNKFVKLFALAYSFLKSLFILNKYKPVKIVSMGGLVSIPVCLAGKIFGIPIEVYELNVEPGKAVKFLANLVPKINICFDETANFFPQKTCVNTQYPIRFDDTSKIKRESALQKISFSQSKKTVLIIGGSQGSLFINNLIKDFIIQNKDLNDKIQIIHQTGSDQFDWQSFYKSYSIPAITFSFYNNMQEYYCAADSVICRSGAGTLAEILFFEIPCITIPLETKSTDHQILNALSCAKKYPDLFFVIKQNNIEQNRDLFFDKLKQLMY